MADIFSGEITSWDDPAIAEHNEDADLPDTPITVIHRSDDSGTTENFTEYLEQASTTWGYEADGEWPGEISAESADGTSGVVDGVSGQDGAITYADAGQIPDELALVSVEVGGEYSEVSPEAASQAVEASDRLEGQAENNLAFELSRDTDEAGATRSSRWPTPSGATSTSPRRRPTWPPPSPPTSSPRGPSRSVPMRPAPPRCRRSCALRLRTHRADLRRRVNVTTEARRISGR